jgi:hypothetical protein
MVILKHSAEETALELFVGLGRIPLSVVVLIVLLVPSML